MTGMELVLPTTGEIVNLADTNEVARAYVALGETETMLRDIRRRLREALIDAASEYGAGTMRTAAAEIKVTEPVDIQWDMEALAELRAAGLPPERWDELVTWTTTPKVSATVARQIAKANPAYAEIVARAERRTPKPKTVSVALRVTAAAL